MLEHDDTTIIPEIFGQYLEKQRNNIPWTRQELANFVGVDVRSIGHWERGKRLPQTEYLRRLAEAFGLKPNELLDGAVAFQKAQLRDNQDKARKDNRTDPVKDPLLTQAEGRLLWLAEKAKERLDIKWHFNGTDPFDQWLEVSRTVHFAEERYAVGALRRTPESKDVLVFRDQIHARCREFNHCGRSRLIYESEHAHEIDIRRDVAALHGMLVQSMTELMGWPDLRLLVDRQTRAIENARRWDPLQYVPQRAEYRLRGRRQQTDDAADLLGGWLNNPAPRFVVVTGNAGVGKTFLLRMLALALGRVAKSSGLDPILLSEKESRVHDTLDRVLDERLDGHVADYEPDTLRAKLREGRIVLLFDGFDDLTSDSGPNRSREAIALLKQATGKRSKVVVACRAGNTDTTAPPVFISEFEHLRGFRCMTLLPFDGRRKETYLKQRLSAPSQQTTRQKLLDILKKNAAMGRLTDIPRVLKTVTDLIEHAGQRVISDLETEDLDGIYERIVGELITREHQRAKRQNIRPDLSIELRRGLITALAIRAHYSRDGTVSADELPNVVAQAAKAAPGVPAHNLEKTGAAPTAVDPQCMTHELGDPTLLVCTGPDRFAFFEESIAEWLVATEAAATLGSDAGKALLGAKNLTDLMIEVIVKRADQDQLQTWTTSMLLGGGTETARRNAMTVRRRCGYTEEFSTKNFAGHDLRRRVLAGRDLSGICFDKADLTDARLDSCDLKNTDFRGARLRRASLRYADLTGADLRKADMTAASLTGADLRGARLDGARLRYADLVGATVDLDALDDVDVRGAALPDPSEVVPMVLSCWTTNATVEWSPDSQFIAVGREDGAVVLWNAKSPCALATLCGHRLPVRTMAFHPDMDVLACGSDDGTVTVWDLTSGRQIQVVENRGGAVNGIAYAHHGRWLAVGSQDGLVRMWRGRGDHSRGTLATRNGPIRSVKVSPDDRFVAAASSDGTISIWSVDDQDRKRTLGNRGKQTNSIAFHPDGRLLAGGTADGNILLWNTDSGQVVEDLVGHRSPVRRVAFSPAGNVLVSCSNDGAVRLWDTDTARPIRRLREHTGFVTSVAFNPTGDRVASASTDGTVLVWDIASGGRTALLDIPRNELRAVTFGRDDRQLFCCGGDGSVHRWDTAKGVRLHSELLHDRPINNVVWHPGTGLLATAGADQRATVYQPARSSIHTALEGHTMPVNSVDISPCGTMVATGSADYTIRIWNRQDGTTRHVLLGHGSYVNGVAFSPTDPTVLASASADGTVRTWDTERGRVTAVSEVLPAFINRVRFSPDGQTLASASSDGSVLLWSAAKLDRLRRVMQLPGSCAAAVFSPDGTHLAVTSDHGSVFVTTISSDRTATRELPRHLGAVRDLCFSPSGRWLASAGDDATVRLWNLAKDRLSAVFLCRPDGWASFTPNGRYKMDGDIANTFWHLIGVNRYEPGDLDSSLDKPLRIPDHEPLLPEIGTP